MTDETGDIPTPPPAEGESPTGPSTSPATGAGPAGQWTPPSPTQDPYAGWGQYYGSYQYPGSYGTWGPQYSPTPPRSRRGPAWLAAIAAGAAVLAAAGIVVREAFYTRVANTPSSSSGLPALGTVTPSVSTPGGGSSSSSSSSSTSTTPLTVDQIAAEIDPAVVDINTTVGAQGSAAGTGMVITGSGQVLTNNHVVQGATSIRVQVAGGGTVYTAHVVAVDVADDIALLQMDHASGLTTINLGDSTKVQVGDSIVAIGNALGRGGTPAVSQGSVTALNRTITASDVGGSNAETLTGLIQIDAPIQPGDSGGPLVNQYGQVVGMDTAAETSGFRRRLAPSTVGFAIPINTAISIAHQMASGQTSPNIQPAQGPLLGVEVQDSATGQSGALVVGVQSGSPAAGAGIVAGDVIVGLGGVSVDSASALGNVIHTHHVGDRVSVTWIDQSGQQRSATVRLAAGPPA